MNDETLRSDPAFTAIEPEFEERIRSTVWCTLTTVDSSGRPRSRIVHPVWEGGIGWLGSRQTPKVGHIERSPHASVMYWDPRHQQVIIDAEASVHTDDATCQRVWDLFSSFPEPYGFDPSPMWKDGSTSDGFVAIKLEPWRIELFGAPPVVWRRT